MIGSWWRIIEQTISLDLGTEDNPKSTDFYNMTLKMVPIGQFCPSPTPTGYFPDMGSPTSDATGNVLYVRPGLEEQYEPTPFFEGDWHFAIYGRVDAAAIGGTCDNMGINVLDIARCIVVGDGTLTAYTVLEPGHEPRDYVASLYHRIGPGILATLDSQQTVAVGEPVTFEVSSHGGLHCVHWVDITDPYPGTPFPTSGIGFDGFDWTLA